MILSILRFAARLLLATVTVNKFFDTIFLQKIKVSLECYNQGLSFLYLNRNSKTLISWSKTSVFK
jgi:hypothetical protein